MRYALCSIYDVKVGVYSPAFAARSKPEAVRMFTTWVNDPDVPMHGYPADFRLYAVAEFDDMSGSVSGGVPEFLASGDTLIQPK